MPLTGGEIDAVVARLERESAEKLHAGDVEGARRLAAQAVALRSLIPELTSRTVRSVDVDTTNMPSSVKRGAARATRKHPAQERFYLKGATVTSVAQELRETRARVSSWMADGDANRPIPRRHAEYLKSRYGIPLSAWQRIAD